jgi:hypothetical protein
LHVSADSTSPRDALLIAFPSSYRIELWFMPSGRGPSGEGNGLSAPPPCRPHRAKEPERLRLSKIPLSVQDIRIRSERLRLSTPRPARDKDHKGEAFVSLLNK